MKSQFFYKYWFFKVGTLYYEYSFSIEFTFMKYTKTFHAVFKIGKYCIHFGIFCGRFFKKSIGDK